MLSGYQQIVVTAIEKLFIAPTLTFFQDHHPHQNADRSVRCTVGFIEKHFEVRLVYLHYNVFVKQIMVLPEFGVIAI